MDKTVMATLTPKQITEALQNCTLDIKRAELALLESKMLKAQLLDEKANSAKEEGKVK